MRGGRLISTFAVFFTMLLASVTGVGATDAETIVRALMPKAPAAQQPVTRSFRPPTRGIEVIGGAGAPEPAPSIDLYVHFEFNESRLTMSDARLTLDALGKALRDHRLAGLSFEIIGHTDQAGTDAYNMDLSLRRARAVSAYLTQYHGISEAQLRADGRGMRELKDPARPLDGINRRVQVVSRGAGGVRPPSPVASLTPPPPPPPAVLPPPAPVFRPPTAQPIVPPMVTPAIAPPSVVRRPWTPRADFGFGDRPQQHINALPDRPNLWTDNSATGVAPKLDLPHQAAAFAGDKRKAAEMFSALYAARFEKAQKLDREDVVSRAKTALEARDAADQSSALETLARLQLNDDRAVSLMLGQAWRIIERDVNGATPVETLSEILPVIFRNAAGNVVDHTRAAHEAARLQRSAENLATAARDLMTQHAALTELSQISADRGRHLMTSLEAQFAALSGSEANPSVAGYKTALEIRRQLLDCVTLRLPAVVQQAGYARLAQATDASLRAKAGWLTSQVVVDAAQHCPDLMAPTAAPPGIPAIGPEIRTQPDIPTRRADADPAPAASTDKALPRLAGRPSE